MYDLKRLFLFEGTDLSEVDDVVGSFPDAVFFAKGTSVSPPAELGRSLGVVVEGRLRSFSGSVLRRSFEPGDVFGAAAVFGEDQGYVTEIKAAADSRVVFIPEPALRRVFERCPGTAVNYIAFLSDKVRFLNRRIAVYTDQGAEAKLYRHVGDNADEGGTYKADSMAALAKTLGVGRTALYRAADALEAKKLLKRDGTRFTLTETGEKK